MFLPKMPSAQSLPAWCLARTPGFDEAAVRCGMHTLYLVDTLNVGGTETQMASAALRLHRAGHRVTVGCLRAEGPLLEVLRKAGIPVVEFPKKKTLLSPNGMFQLLRMVLFLRRHNFQVVHAHDLWANLFGVPAAWLAGTPMIISGRRYLADLEWYTPWRNRIMRVIYRLSTYVVVNSESVRKLLVERDGLPPQKVRVIHNAVDVEQFVGAQPDKQSLLPGVGKNTKLIAVIANMYSPVKGHDHLIAAAGTVCRIEPEATFLLIGDGPERPKLERQVAGADLSKNVLFLGRRNDIPELLACCNLSVLPSEAEGLPNALLEAMAAGLPVVATRVGGTPEVIEDGVSGLLVAARAPHALAGAILRILRDSKLATRLAQAGQKRMRTHFSFDRLMAELEELYAPAPGTRRFDAVQHNYTESFTSS
jgi:glycosyltransferase involved in cell wall biosynthesis